MRSIFTPLLIVFPSLSFAQYTSDLPHPVQMIASFAREIAVCEAAQPVFRGETAKYLHAVDSIAPGYLNTAELDARAKELVSMAKAKDLSKATEGTCNERIFPVAKRALDALPCYRDHAGKECPAIN